MTKTFLTTINSTSSAKVVLKGHPIPWLVTLVELDTWPATYNVAMGVEIEYIVHLSLNEYYHIKYN